MCTTFNLKKNKITKQSKNGDTIINKDLRSISANKNAIFMLFLKGINIVISLMYVPLLINALSSYKYGIWLTVTSILGWLNLFDMGLGNGLRNKLSESLARNNTKEAKHLISTAYASIAILTLVINALFFSITNFLDWSNILNVPETMRNEVTNLINIVFILVSIQFILSIINSILFAFQKPAYSALVTTIGQLLAFGLVSYSVIILNDYSLLRLGIIISASPALALTIFSLYYFLIEVKAYRPSLRYVKFTYLNNILSLGVKFFIIQIITIILFQTSNIIIAQNIGQEAVAEYNIIYKYIGIIYLAFSIIVTPYWSASTEAYIRGDIQWIKKSIRKLKKIAILLSLVGVNLLLHSEDFYRLWIGTAIHIDNTSIFLGLVYFILLIQYNTYGYILNGIGKIQIQLIITSIVAVIFIPTTIFLSGKYGLNGVFLSLILTAFINATWSSIQFNKIINGKAKGLWLK